MTAIDLGIKPMWREFDDWLDSWLPHYPKAQFMALVAKNDALRSDNAMYERRLADLRRMLEYSDDALTAKTLELETLKNKIVERARVEPILKAKSAAQIRQMVEAQNEREFEESQDGLR